MLLMNSSDPTFKFSTRKPQNLKLHPFPLNISSSLKNESKNMSNSIAISYSKPTISPSNHTHCSVTYIAIEDDLPAKDRDNRNSLFKVHATADFTGGGGGRIYRGGDDDDDEDYHENDSADVFYQSMIEANPKNSLILGNYGIYLKEVRGDFTKAMEYCNKSILVDPSDGIILSMYADLIWSTQNDAVTAENYFKQAVEASPHDCHILASYAGFLWEAE